MDKKVKEITSVLTFALIALASFFYVTDGATWLIATPILIAGTAIFSGLLSTAIKSEAATSPHTSTKGDIVNFKDGSPYRPTTPSTQTQQDERAA